jgi:3-hydroxymyristoyl/3-hydroxydecanoyl-(acyl carrier protein) dehydratase
LFVFRLQASSDQWRDSEQSEHSCCDARAAHAGGLGPEAGEIVVVAGAGNQLFKNPTRPGQMLKTAVVIQREENLGIAGC